jgi:hypothetical protein
MSDIGKGIHFHVFGVAIVDVIGTIVGGLAIAYYMKWSVPLTLFGVFVLGIILHRIFNIRSTVDRFLFPNEK